MCVCVFVCVIVFVRRGRAVVGGGRGCVQACTHSRACRDGRSPLHAASDEGHVSCVEALIGSKADVLCTNDTGESPAQVALSRGHSDCVAALVRAGAAPP